VSSDLRALAGPARPLARDRLAVHAADAARSLLGLLVVRDLDGGTVVARIVETEAYREDDPASHTFGRRTPRVEPMFGAPGTAYVYRSYGVHWCCNVAVEGEGVGAAVLLRAAVVIDGATAIRARRPAVRGERDLLRGPGNLCRGLAVTAPEHDGGDLVEGVAGLRLADDGWRPDPRIVVAGPRVGVSRAAHLPWRFHLADVPEVSRYVRSPRARHER
jgi:DNA-3-methyladenine glycosylase